ncbi:MAG: dTDP-glucose 4,6-dehydratase [Neisseriaceae bacterium]
MKKTILITGGAGFIGRHVVEHFLRFYPSYHCLSLDNLSQASTYRLPDSVTSSENFTFIEADVANYSTVLQVLRHYRVVGVVNLAAYTHVDHSIQVPQEFVENNVLSMVCLLEACRTYLKEQPLTSFRLLHVSTDEVFGSIQAPGLFSETHAYHPRSPYSASKAAADHIAMAYHHTYQFPCIISYCTNNFGPYQRTEKLIPHTIFCALQQQPIPIYGDGQQVRDWIPVLDHVQALDLIFRRGKVGSQYGISAHHELTNLALVRYICQYLETVLGHPSGRLTNLITHVRDRPGHDARYALSTVKIEQELAWKPKMKFKPYLKSTIEWYLKHRDELINAT